MKVALNAPLLVIGPARVDEMRNGEHRTLGRECPPALLHAFELGSLEEKVIIREVFRSGREPKSIQAGHLVARPLLRHGFVIRIVPIDLFGQRLPGIGSDGVVRLLLSSRDSNQHDETDQDCDRHPNQCEERTPTLRSSPTFPLACRSSWLGRRRLLFRYLDGRSTLRAFDGTTRSGIRNVEPGAARVASM